MKRAMDNVTLGFGRTRMRVLANPSWFADFSQPLRTNATLQKVFGDLSTALQRPTEQ
jgi:hypothetical protein